MNLVALTAPKDVELHIHFSWMTATEDVMPNIEEQLSDFDLLMLPVLGWDGELVTVFNQLSDGTISSEATTAHRRLDEYGDFAHALGRALHRSKATVPVICNDLPDQSDGAEDFAKAHHALCDFRDSIARSKARPSFDIVVAECKQHCIEFNKQQLKRMNHILKRFNSTIKRARMLHPQLQVQFPLRVLALQPTDHMDLLQQFQATAENEPAFKLTHSVRPVEGDVILAQYNEFVKTGNISGLAAARVMLVPIAAAKVAKGELSVPLRAAANARLAAMDISAIKQLYER